MQLPVRLLGKPPVRRQRRQNAMVDPLSRLNDRLEPRSSDRHLIGVKIHLLSDVPYA
jgi:hypothetical protein